MAKTAPFEKYTDRYEEWFEQNSRVYEAELRAVKDMLPPTGLGLEIGVGTGRFAEPLDIKYGIDPCGQMGNIAGKRGILVSCAVAEELPFADSIFDFVLMVTTICFVDDIDRSLGEAYRVLSENGNLVIGFVDRNSKIGKTYLEHQEKSVFYREATFLSVEQLIGHAYNAGFRDPVFNQTIFGPLEETKKDEQVKPGHGEGSFLVMKTSRQGKGR